jgi:RNA polymerase sigma factor (sigma-70 family)
MIGGKPAGGATRRAAAGEYQGRGARMPGTRPTDILRRVDPSGAADRALATQYAFHNDEAAFAEIVRRHGPVVWAACLRVAGHRQDAEDAFQAAFLLFSRRLAAIRDLDLLGNWLYGAAVRVSLRARRAAARRRRREVQVPTMPDPPCHAPDATADLRPVIDAELAALPGHYRDAVVLCDLRGASRLEAAALLGLPEGTVSSRLANGRKKLAARLAARGVTLSVAAVPAVLSAGARAAVPAGLAARVVQVATGSVAPAAVVARLASGGTVVEKLFLFGVACAAAAGVVYAAAPADTPPAEPPQPAAAAKADPQPKADAKAEPSDKAAFTTNPRLGATIDLGLSGAWDASWSPDGRSLVVQGEGKAQPVRGSNRREARVVTQEVDDGGRLRAYDLFLHKTATMVRFAPDGKSVVTDVRESGLLSGRHALWFQELQPNGFFLSREVALDATDTQGYAFAADGKTFRTLAVTRDGDGVEVREVDATTGRTRKTLMKVGRGPVQLSPDGRRLARAEFPPDAKDGKVVVYDVDRGAELASAALPVIPPPKDAAGPDGAERWLGRQRRALLTFSPDGGRLVVARERGHTVVLDADTGKALPRLEGVDLVRAYEGTQSFSGDGRLLALNGTRFVEQPDKAKGGEPIWSGVGCLVVWDTRTGEALKSWDRNATVALHPTKPILAVLEPNGQETRLGLWDFAAEVQKK